jgi:TonB-dependent receptor
MNKSPGFLIILVTVLLTGFPVTVCSQEIKSATELEGSRPSSTESSRLKIQPPNILEEIVVLGTRTEGGSKSRSTASSRRDLQRSDETDMLGFFDDIDGISTLGGDDEGNAFSIDGMGSDLGMVTVNGQGLGQGRGNDGLGASDLPPDMILRVDMYKTPTASMEEGGSSGVVDLKLRNALGLPRPSTSLKARLGHVPENNDFNPSANLFLGRPSESRNFGYMLNVAMHEHTRQYGSQIISSWNLHEDEDTSSYIPNQVRSDAVKIDERRILASLGVGFRPHPSLEVSANLLLSQLDKDTASDSLQHRLERQKFINILDADERIATELESDDPRRNNLRLSGSKREDEVKSRVLGGDFAWRHKRWTVQGAAGYGVDKNKNDIPSQSAVFDVNSAFGYLQGKDDSLAMNYADGFPLVPDFSFSNINLSDRDTRDTNLFGNIDVSRRIGGDFFRRFFFGAKTRELSRERDSSRGNPGLEDRPGLDEYFSGRYQRTPWDMTWWPSIDMNEVDSTIAGSEVVWKENPLNEYDIEQNTDAVYIQADFRATLKNERFLIGNVGVRLVDTRTRIAGYQDQGDGLRPFTQVNRYTDVLPSFGTRIRVAERAALTLGVARVMTHPSFNDLAPGIRINNADKTAKAGNPDLEPFRAELYLAELTWAPVRGSRLNATLAYRDVESFFVVGEQSVEINDSTYIIMRPINGYDGSILTAGINLDQNLRRITQHLRNFSLSLSYTHNHTNTKMKDPFTGEDLPMPKTAEHVARAALLYQTNKYSGSLMYQWRGESLKSSFNEGGMSVWNQPLGSLNLNLGWQINTAFQLGIDARNLLNEDQTQSTDISRQLLRITERNRTLALTLRARW